MSNRMWGGRFASGPSAIMQAINASISFDRRLAPYDLRQSRAHAQALAKLGVLTQGELKEMLSGLEMVERERPDVARALFGADSRLPMLFQYNPIMHHAEVNDRGEVVEGTWPVNKAAFAIHSQVHAARPDVTASGGQRLMIAIESRGQSSARDAPTSPKLQDHHLARKRCPTRDDAPLDRQKLADARRWAAHISEPHLLLGARGRCKHQR